MGTSATWLLGVFLSIIGSTLSNTGLNVQKYSFLKQAKLPEEMRLEYYKQWRWIVGICLVILGAIGDFTALTFAPQSVIMPVGAFTLVCNVVLAHFWLKERITKMDLMGTAMIIVGAVLVAAFGSREDSSFTLDELVDLYLRWEMLAYGLCIGIIIAGLYTSLQAAEYRLKKFGPASVEYKYILKLHPLSYAGLAGTFGAQSVMFAKSTAELIKVSASGDSQFGSPLTYLIIAAMICTIFLQTHYLALGLKHFDALYIVPVFQCFFITLSVLGGAVYFKELGRFNTLQWFMFPVGVFVIISGVVIMSSREMESSTASTTQSQEGYQHIEEQQDTDVINFEHLFDTVLDPVYHPVADEDEELSRSTSLRMTGLAPVSLIQVSQLLKQTSHAASRSKSTNDIQDGKDISDDENSPTP